MVRRSGCALALGIVSLTPGVALLAAGGWVHAQGGGRAVLVAGAVVLGLGCFVSIAIGAVLRRPTPDALDRAREPPA